MSSVYFFLVCVYQLQTAVNTYYTTRTRIFSIQEIQIDIIITTMLNKIWNIANEHEVTSRRKPIKNQPRGHHTLHDFRLYDWPIVDLK